jgi:hypothetical protein
MKILLQVVVAVATLIALALLADAWRTARRDAAQLNTLVATQNAQIQQSEAHEKQRDTQLASALTEIAAQQRAVKTPQQAAQTIPSVLPPLPLPIKIDLPSLTSPANPETAEPAPATMTIPQADLKPLYDDLQDCRANALQAAGTQKDLTDAQAAQAALTKERDAAIAAARGGSFWSKLKRSAKWFAIGLAIGAAAAHH